MINNPYTEQYIKYNESNLATKLEEKFAPKPYRQRYKPFRFLGLLSSYILNVFSCITASAFVYFFLESLLDNIYISSSITFIFLIIAESAKRSSSSRIIIDYFVYKTWNIPFIIFSLALIAMSIVFSYNGSQTIILKYSSPPDLIDEEKEIGYQFAMITDINQQIALARETKYNGTTTRTSQKTIDKLTDQLSILQNELSQTKANIQERNNALIREHESILGNKALYMALFTSVLELLFLVCIWYLQYYDYRTYIELKGVDVKQATKEATSPKKNALDDIEIKKLKNKIRTYYKRAINPKSSKEARDRNMKKILGWVGELRLSGVRTELEKEGPVVFGIDWKSILE